MTYEDYPDFQKYIEKVSFWWFLVIIIGMALVACVLTLAGAEIEPSDNLWRGLIAEAAGEGEQGMYAVACCVRNRIKAGMNIGLCGLKRGDLDEFVRKQGRKIEFIAKDIVKKVFKENSSDNTFGATHYEAIERYSKPTWAKNMIVTIKIGAHTFYKEKDGY